MLLDMIRVGRIYKVQEKPMYCESLNESVLVEMYKSCKTEVRCQFLSSTLKDGQSLERLFLPYNVNIFKKEVQMVMSLVSQILGLDDDIHVSMLETFSTIHTLFGQIVLVKPLS